MTYFSSLIIYFTWILCIVFTITTPMIINVSPIIVGMLGIWLYLKTPMIVIAAIHSPDQVAYVIPTGMNPTTCDIK